MKTAVILLALGLLNVHKLPKKHNVIQLEITPLLNARAVTTRNNNHLVTWTKGIDGGGIGDGYLTQSAATFNSDKAAHALPDNPLILANDAHPAILLHYKNGDSLHNQTFNMAGEGSFEFKVIKAHYKDLYLALTSSEGASALTITFIYATDTETKDFILPDYYADLPPNDPNLCYLLHDLAKWGNKNNMTEKDHHNIDLLNIHPNRLKTLENIRVSKTKAGYLVFWAATGVVN